MKTITLAFVFAFGAFLLTGCNETKDATENESKQESQTEQKNEVSSNDEKTMKENSVEESKTDAYNKEESDKTQKLKVEDSKLESASFKVPTIHCSGCEETISTSVKKLNGIQDVKADFDTKLVSVTYAGDKVTKEEIAKAIDASGFKCEINN